MATATDYFIINESATAQLQNLADFVTKLNEYTVPNSELGSDLSLSELGRLRMVADEIVKEAQRLQSRVDFLLRTAHAKTGK